MGALQNGKRETFDLITKLLHSPIMISSNPVRGVPFPFTTPASLKIICRQWTPVKQMDYLEGGWVT